MKNQIQMMEINKLVPYDKNPRNNEKAVSLVADSISEFGFNQPIVVDKNNVIVVGHTRWKASKELGLKQVPVLYMPDDVNDAKVKAYRIADNRLNELADWDNDLLIDELSDLDELSFDLDSIGFDLNHLMSKAAIKDENWLSLADQFVVPPFSIFDARGGDWFKRKQQWKGIGISSELGRATGLSGNAEGPFALNAGTSVFDPVLVEVILLWFSKMGAKVLDPFAGGSVRGIVSTILGRDYTGIDLRDIQIEANQQNWTQLSANGFKRLPAYIEAETIDKPNWITGDSNVVLDDLEDESYDMVMTCPPYADLEVYSDLDGDISNMEYNDFLNIYSSIITKSAAKLKNDSFMIIVVGDLRDKAGAYRGFIGDTVQSARQAGLTFYNEIIYITPSGPGSMLAKRPFLASRKLRKHHQNVLVFVKGDPKVATHNAGTVLVDPFMDL